LRKIFGSVQENSMRRIRTNCELMGLCREVDISEIRKARLRWLGHVERMPEEKAMKKLFKNIRGRRYLGKPRKKWLDDVENDLKRMGVKKLERNS
jgi:hypothetical protein